MSSIYIHIPFCERKCLYCDFPSAPHPDIAIDEYVEAVVREMELRAGTPEAPHDAETVYFGGGTPSLLDPSHVGMLLDEAARRFGIGEGAEVTLEVNPGTITPEKFTGWRSAGVNRISLGVQSFDDRLLARLGRIHSAADASAAVEMARRAGFDNVGIDLIHTLPGQDLRMAESDLRRAVEHAPEHVSVYALSVEEGTPFHRMHEDGLLDLPPEDEAAMIFDMARGFLGAAGYEHYEISNFARPGRRSRHNTAYWRRTPYTGFGAAAHSFSPAGDGGSRWKNSVGLAAYMAALRSGRLPEEDREVLSVEDSRSEFMFLGLRLLDGVDGEEFRRLFGTDLRTVYGETLDRLLKQGLLLHRGARIFLSEKAIPLANQVFMQFL